MIRLLVAVVFLSGCAGGAATATSPVDPTTLLDESERATLFVFSTLWCATCERERPGVVAFAEERADDIALRYVVSGSSVAAVDEWYADGVGVPRASLVVDTDGAVARLYSVESTPTFVLVEAGAETLRTPALSELAGHLEADR